MFKKELSHCSRLILSPPAILTIPPGTPCRWLMHCTHAGHARHAREVCLQGVPLALATGVPWLRVGVRRQGGFPPCTQRARFYLASLPSPSLLDCRPRLLSFLSHLTLRRVDYLNSPLTSTYRAGQKTTWDHTTNDAIDAQPQSRHS